MIIGDSHCDTLNEMADRGCGFWDGGCCVSGEKLAAYDGYIQFFACFISPRFYDAPMSRFVRLYEKYIEETDKNKDKIARCVCYEDMKRALEHRRIAAFLTLEGAECIQGADDVDALYNMGVRVITLTWNYRNRLASGAFEKSGGLTRLGREVIKRMNTLGMHVDVSHLNEQSFYEVCEASAKPVFATHSCARAICDNKRNLTNSQILEIIRQGGYIGVSIYPFFLTNSDKADLHDFIRHIDLILSLGGENNIGIGSDFDGIECFPSGVDSCADLRYILEKMREDGYKKETIDKFAHKNLERMIKFF